MMTVHSQAIGQICDAAVVCLFAWKGAGSNLAMLRDMLNAVTGYGLTVEDLLEMGNRIWYLKRALCNLCGVTRADDRVPRRIVEPHLEGEAVFLLPALNPMIRSSNRIIRGIRSRKFLGLIKEFNRRVLLRHTFTAVDWAGKLLPQARASVTSARSRGPGERGAGGVDLDSMLEEFYRLRRLDERGFPEAEVLQSLGLDDVSRALHGDGRTKPA